jgi:disulfide bond formation protein DsbB
MASRGADAIGPARGGTDALKLAKLLALLLPAGLLAGAYGSQYLGGLVPCEMCHWQRWPHWAALGLAIGAFLLARMPDRGRSLVWLAALAIFTSGGIGVYHSGVEMGIISGATPCSQVPTAQNAEALYADLMSRSMVRCDEIQFKALGISMAGWNAIISISGALVIAWLSLKRPRTQTQA